MELIDAVTIVGYIFGFLLAFVLLGLGGIHLSAYIWRIYQKRKYRGSDPDMG